MRFLKRFSLTAVLVITSFLWPVLAQDIVVAQVASKTNPNSAQLANGLELGYRVYFDEINSKGGIHGRRLVLRNIDDNFSPAKMIDATRAIAADPSVLAGIGFVGSASLLRLAKEDILADLKLPLIAPLQGDKVVVGAANVFPFRASYEDEIVEMARHAVEDYKRKRIAVIHLEAAFGTILAESLEKSLAGRNLRLVARASYEIAPDRIEASARQAVRTVLAAQPDAVVLVAAGKVGSTLIAELRADPEVRPTIYALSALQFQDVVAQLGPSRPKGIIFAQAVPFPYSGATPFSREYRALMARHAPEAPLSFLSLEGVAGAKILAAALQKVGPNPTRERLLSTLNSIGTVDLGGFSVQYGAGAKRGWGRVELTIATDGGRLAH